MKIIADSGSTKTAWRLVKNDNSIVSLETEGINPYYQGKEEISKFLEEKLLPQISEEIKEIHFYGAGCTTEKEEFVRDAISSVLPSEIIEVKSDLYGAARALCFDEPGIVCILGTGANSCYYDGNVIVENISPLGFILGDEGSAAVLGKKLIADYLKKMMPESLRHEFAKDYSVTASEVLNRVYRSEFPNRFLAGFVPFLSKNIANSYCEKLVVSEFQSFISRNVLNYSKSKSILVSFTGSVAFYFEAQLRMVLQSNGLTLGKIVRQPIELLTQYHTGLEAKC